MKATYYIKITPRRIWCMSDREFLTQVGRDERAGWVRIEAWNRYHAKQLGMEYRQALKEIQR